ncbi:MAG: addiction module protein [Thermoanaerobaculia bacterium]
MALRFETLLESALELPTGDRARIATELIASLDGQAEAGVEAAWIAEVDRRIVQVERGEAQRLDRDIVSAEIRESLRRK